MLAFPAWEGFAGSVQFTKRPPAAPGGAANGLARALSKLGVCSRREAWLLVQAGRVRVNGKVRLDPEWRVVLARDLLELDGQPVRAQAHVYLMLNKPRGLVTTARDEQGRATVFRCLERFALPHVSPVGRLDQASEGLLLFTNDTVWASRLTNPASHVVKTYHVQVDRLADEDLLRRLEKGCAVDGEWLRIGCARLLRQGAKNSWLELSLDEGKNRHIRRLLGAFEVNVLRLIRVALGPLALGTLAKGTARSLSPAEVRLLREAKPPRRSQEVR